MFHPAIRSYAGIPGYVVGWILFIAALCIFAYIIKKRWLLLRAGRPDPRLGDWRARLKSLFIYGILQKRQPRYLWAGVIHIVIFWGFVILGLRSLDLLSQALGIAGGLMEGGAGVFYGHLRDVTELCVLFACLWAALRRLILRPERYRGSSGPEAYLVLFLISFLMATDLVFDGTGLLIRGASDGPPGALTASALFSGSHPSLIKNAHALSFWLHIGSFLFFLCFLPLGKHFHIITALPNVFFSKLQRGAIKPARWDAPNLEELETIGVRSLEDFTWKHILDLYSCTECGRCTDRCPAYAAGRPLSPKELTLKLREHAYSSYPIFGRKACPSSDKEEGLEIPGGVVEEEIIWSCTTCGACEEECPVFIEYIDKVVDLRRRLVETSRAPKGFGQVFQHLEKTGNPFGKPASKRADWTKGLEGLSVKLLKPGERTECLFFVDSYPSFDPRAQAVSGAVAGLLQAADVPFGILGQRERDSGHQVRRMGEEGLFQLLCEENKEAMGEIDCTMIVTADPHAFNTIRNDYGISKETLHYSMLLDRLISKGALRPSRRVEEGRYVFHDPCYLGRHNGVYDAPRRVLSALPGMRLLEMERSRDKSFCCGGADVILWHEIKDERERPASIRVKMAVDAGADVLVTACPFCLIHFEDAVKTAGLEGMLRVVDLAELTLAAVQGRA
jgi:Fe-S oxidoreductase